MNNLSIRQNKHSHIIFLFSAFILFQSIIISGCGNSNSRGRNSIPAGSSEKAGAACPVGMVFIPAGHFKMGCGTADDECYEDEKPARDVTVEEGFCIDKLEVTQRDYQEIMKENPSNFKSCGVNCPVEKVTWSKAVEYCGKTGKRLPTEWEWEYAARGGKKERYPGMKNQDIIDYNNAPGLGEIAWYGGNSGVDYPEGYDCGFFRGRQLAAKKCGAHPVGSKPPNGFGLYDMQGNAAEWTADCYDSRRYSETPGGKPGNRGEGNCLTRSIRGGSWYSFAWDARVSFRDRKPEDVKYDTIGFRCAAKKR